MGTREIRRARTGGQWWIVELIVAVLVSRANSRRFAITIFWGAVLNLSPCGVYANGLAIA